MNKSALHKLYLGKRRELSPDEIELKTRAITNNFSTLDLSGIKYLHVFYPIAGKSEFNTLLLVNYIRDTYPQIKLVLSRSNLETHTLSHFIWETDTPLAVNTWGLTEPTHGSSIQPELLDMVLVPLLAFDKKGHRVGYGKGFYDRFLSDCRPDVQKTGISFFPPVEMIKDVNEQDISLDSCITPEKIWRFENETR